MSPFEIKKEPYIRKSVNQQLFDKVVKHMYKQGKQALVRGSCVYRAADGGSCAVGCLMNDEQMAAFGVQEGIFTPSWADHPESNTDNILKAIERTVRRPLDALTPDMLKELQLVHDGNSALSAGTSNEQQKDLRTNRVKQDLYRVATKFNLNTKVLDRVYKDVA